MDDDAILSSATADGPEWISPISEGHPMLDGIIRSNGQRLAQLTAQNVGIDVTRVMVQTLIEDLFPERGERQVFEQRFQNQLANIITQVEQQVARAKLQAGPSGLLVPGVG